MRTRKYFRCFSIAMLVLVVMFYIPPLSLRCPLTNSFRCPLFMDCVDDGLSEAQKRAKADKSAKFTEQMKKLEAMAKAGARIIQHDNGSVTFR